MLEKYSIFKLNKKNNCYGLYYKAFILFIISSINKCIITIFDLIYHIILSFNLETFDIAYF